MIYINLSYFDNVLGPETLCTVPVRPEEDIEECTNSLLNISEFIELKFFVYISSEHFKTSNIYTKIPSEWARGKVEMLLISVILVDEAFSRLYLFEEVLEEIVNAINNIDHAYKAFYAKKRGNSDTNEINSKKDEIINVLNGFLPKINQVIEAATMIPLESEVIDTMENLQDEFIIVQKHETALEVAKKLAVSPRVLIGCVVENNKPIGIVDEDDILNGVFLKGKDPTLTKIEDVMTKDVIMVDSNDPIDKIIDLMIDNGIRAVPILQNDEFFGVFTIFDGVQTVKNILGLIGEHLMDISGRKLEDVKQLKVKLWSYVRNISRNQRIMELQKKKQN